jgi:hypothetical protein
MRANVPKAREILEAMIDPNRWPSRAELDTAIRRALMLMTKASPVRRAKAKRRAMTPRLRDQLKRVAAENPQLDLLEIAHRFDINQAAVSRALTGYYDKLVGLERSPYADQPEIRYYRQEDDDARSS